MQVATKPLAQRFSEDRSPKNTDQEAPAAHAVDLGHGHPPLAEPWRRRFVPSALRRERLAGQVVRFGMVGAMNTAVDWGLFLFFNILFRALTQEALVTHRRLYLAANAVAVSAGILNSFLWNKHWTFSAGRSRRTGREAVIFVAISISSLGINTTGLWVLSHIFTGTTLLTVVVHKLGTSIVTMTWNFLGYRFIAFRATADKRAGA
jgi:putative flippase GtrA